MERSPLPCPPPKDPKRPLWRHTTARTSAQDPLDHPFGVSQPHALALKIPWITLLSSPTRTHKRFGPQVWSLDHPFGVTHAHLLALRNPWITIRQPTEWEGV